MWLGDFRVLPGHPRARVPGRGGAACGEVTIVAECPLMNLITACPCVICFIICQSKSYRPMKSLFLKIFNILNTLGVLFPTRSISLI